MNLLQEAWMPVRRRDGSREWIVPDRLAEPDIVAFDADRPDFNGALAQFAIGLLQTTAPVDSPVTWRRLFDKPPDPDTLRQWFAPVVHAFRFDGNEARFMQDLSLGASEGVETDIGSLLIDSPGENALKNNADHFVKRGRVREICTDCAAMALMTLQINAPAGGVGNRTGLRGGGPLTTLVISEVRQSLWHDLWLNVREQSAFLVQCGDQSKQAGHFMFPWLQDIEAIQTKGGETVPAQVHPVHVFWASPRRIRLNFEDASAGDCDICARPSERLVRRYISKNYGLNYKGVWEHPLSPYYAVKEEWLPIHPQPGGFGYRHWLGWVFGVNANNKRQRPARVVDHVLVNRRRQAGTQLRLWAFGYDMDNMKPRCWYESTLPLYGLADCEPDARRRVAAEVNIWLAGADMAAFYLRSAVKDAWFGADARGDFSAIDAGFWGRTEAAFYLQLKMLIDCAHKDADVDAWSLKTREAWHRLLANTAIKLFDDVFVGAGPVERQNPRRVAKAFLQMKRNVHGPKMRQSLGLPPLSLPRPV
jgi:CRISPR system Cascade subunit CasA